MKTNKKFNKALFITLLSSAALVAIPAVTLTSCKFEQTVQAIQNEVVTNGNLSVDVTKSKAIVENNSTMLTIEGTGLSTQASDYSLSTVAKADNTSNIEIVDGSTANKVTLKLNVANNDLSKDETPSKIKLTIKNGNDVIQDQVFPTKVKMEYKKINPYYIQLTDESKNIVGFRNRIGRSAIKLGIGQHVLNNNRNEIYNFRMGNQARITDPFLKKLLNNVNNHPDTEIELVKGK